MNNIILKNKLKIENMIYEIREKQVMLDSKIVVAKCHNHIHDDMIMHWDIDLLI